MLNYKELAKLTGGTIVTFYQDLPIHHLLLDTRKIVASQSSVFFAIKGDRHNGHQFIKDAYKKGVRQFIVEEIEFFKKEEYEKTNILLVTSSVAALQQIAALHRRKFHLPVLAITGSNGKTIVKEWISQLLAKDFHLIYSPKSYNSQVGVPLSVWGINDQHNFGIFEAGISRPGEMENLAVIIRPTLGLFTNIGPAHDEGFVNIEEKIKEKMKLFSGAGVLFYCTDHLPIDQAVKSGNYNFKTFVWSKKSKEADVYVKKIEKSIDQTRIHLVFRDEKYILISLFNDEASIENLLHCINILLYHSLSFEEIQKRIMLLIPVSMRLELKQGLNGCYLIDDTYNNDLAGISMAFNFLGQHHLKKEKRLFFQMSFRQERQKKKCILSYPRW